MIISVPHRFVFLSIPKCASTAIEAELCKHATISMRSPASLKHCTLTDYQCYLEPLLAAKRIEVDTFEIYALFRNPAEWVESWWRFRSRDDLARPTHINHQNYAGHVSLDQFAKAYASDHPPSYARIQTQAEFIEDRSGSTGRVHLFRYEDMDAFVNHLSDRLGADIAVKRKNQSPPRSGRLSEDAINGLRAHTPRDFAIYDSIPRRPSRRVLARPPQDDNAPSGEGMAGSIRGPQEGVDGVAADFSDPAGKSLIKRAIVLTPARRRRGWEGVGSASDPFGFVIPAQAGIQSSPRKGVLDTGFRRCDGWANGLGYHRHPSAGAS